MPVGYPVVVRAVPVCDGAGAVAPEVRSGAMTVPLATEPPAAAVSSPSEVVNDESIRAAAKTGNPARKRARKTAAVKTSTNTVKTDVQPGDGARAAP